MSKYDDSCRLVEGVREGDFIAEKQLFDDYMKRLVGLVSKRLPERFNSRASPDSAAASAIGDCIVGIRDGRYTFNKSGDIWRLLTSIAINKLKQRIRDHSRGKRDVNREDSGPMLGSVDDKLREMISQAPGPDEEAVLAELLQILINQEEWSPKRQHVVALTLQGFGAEDVARSTGASLSLVKTTRRELENSLSRRLAMP